MGFAIKDEAERTKDTHPRQSGRSRLIAGTMRPSVLASLHAVGQLE
jgi:hypothetical protein